MQDFKWTFEPNEPGRREGLNHPGLSFFRGHRFRSLAREMIQNSLDAADGSGKPVKVRMSLRKDIEFGRRDLLKTFDQCAEGLIGTEGDDYKQIDLGSQILKRRGIPCLVVEDYNTVGLAGPRLELLIKGDAASYKDRLASLGNRGIGKYAAFAVSALYTVLYSSQFVDEDTNEVLRAFQGKSSLVSHHDTSGQQRGRTGYYGIDQWFPYVEPALSESGIPENVRRSEIGTNIIIVVFSREDDWEKELTKSIISNFYFAILSKRLEVEIKEENGVTRAINNQTISELFDSFADPEDADDPASVAVAREHFWCIADPTDPSRLSPPTQTGQLATLGHCMAWIRVEDGLPRRVEVVRHPGMVICDGVRRFPGIKNLRRHWSDFAAVVVCRSEEGNDLLKRMEPPEHNDFQPELLDDMDERRQGESALRELGGKIREWLDFMMPLPESDDPQPVRELAEFFPAEDETSDGGGTDEIDPFGAVKVDRVRERLPVLTRQTPQVVVGDIGTGDDDYEHDDGKKSNGDRDRANESEDGKTRKQSRQRAIGVSDVRFTRPEENEVTVWFTVNEEVTAASVSVRVGSEERVRDDSVGIVRLRDRAGNEIKQGAVVASPGERIQLNLITAEPFPPDRALVVDLSVEADEKR